MKDLPHRIVTGKRLHWEATDWCTEKFGRRWEAVGHRQGTWCVLAWSWSRFRPLRVELCI